MEKTDAVLQSTAPRVLLKNVQSQEPRYWSRALHAFFHVGFPPTLSFFARRFGFDAANSELGKKNKPLLFVIPWFCSPDGGWLGDKMGVGNGTDASFRFSLLLHLQTTSCLVSGWYRDRDLGTWLHVAFDSGPGCDGDSFPPHSQALGPLLANILTQKPLALNMSLDWASCCSHLADGSRGGLFIHVPFLSHPLADSRTHQFCLFSLHVPSTLLPTTPHAMPFPLAPSHLLLHPGDPSPELGSGHGWRCASGCLSVIARC